ncbi:MAG TPA: chemotaxis protein, partial [Spirochaetia bacterium]|nr:chemotaxis protein [Spirochaetia bacterium]
MRNLRLAGKIGVGFGLVIAIAMALGAVAVVSMMGVQGDAGRLSDEIVPQVAVANNIERSALLTMYTMRGYAQSGNPDELAKARQNLTDMEKALTDAERLAVKFPRLVVLKKNSVDATTKVNDYKLLFNQTETTINKIHDLHQTQDTAASSFMNACATYLTRNTANLQAAIARRASAAEQRNDLAEITVIGQIIDLGSELRLANYESQTLG